MSRHWTGAVWILSRVKKSGETGGCLPSPESTRTRLAEKREASVKRDAFQALFAVVPRPAVGERLRESAPRCSLWIRKLQYRPPDASSRLHCSIRDFSSLQWLMLYGFFKACVGRLFVISCNDYFICCHSFKKVQFFSRWEKGIACLSNQLKSKSNPTIVVVKLFLWFNWVCPHLASAIWKAKTHNW